LNGTVLEVYDRAFSVRAPPIEVETIGPSSWAAATLGSVILILQSRMLPGSRIVCTCASLPSDGFVLSAGGRPRRPAVHGQVVEDIVASVRLPRPPNVPALQRLVGPLTYVIEMSSASP
jgi:hypothetical protein